MAIHHALHEVVALHAILVRGAVREIRESGEARRGFLEFPEILQFEPHVVADWPVVVFPLDGTGQRAALRVALDAGIAGRDVVHAGGIERVAAGRMLHVLAARAVAALAADVPFGHLFRVNVVIDGVATVAGRPGGPLHVVGRIERLPPIGSFGHEIRAPRMMHDVPLRGLGKIVVADLREVALLPYAAVDECDVTLRELGDWVVC